MGRTRDLAGQHGLTMVFSQHDRFAACTNHAATSQVIIRSEDALGSSHDDRGLPMRASEDFGSFGNQTRSGHFPNFFSNLFNR
jgi:hypothetical protein